MAAVFRGQGGDERGPPPGNKAVVEIKGAQAGKAGIDSPQYTGPAPGHLVDVDGPGLQGDPGHIASVVVLGIIQPRNQFRGVLVVLHCFEAPDAQAVGLDRDPHGPVEIPEMGVDFVAVPAHQNEFPRLVRGNGQADAQLFQNLRQIAGEDAV